MKALAAENFDVPERPYSFSTVNAAQALGDFQVLLERGRRVLRVHAGTDLDGALKSLASVIDAALN